MADLRIKDFSDFSFITPPKKGAILSAIETLISIDALNKNHELTELGSKMVSFPLEPRLSRILLETALSYPEVGYNVLIVISFLSTKTPFLYPHGEEIESRQAQKKLFENGGDFFTWINLFYKYTKDKNKEEFCKKYYLDIRSMNEIVNIHTQLLDMLKERHYSVKSKFDYNSIIHCVCTGLQQYICKKSKKKKTTYYSATETDVRIHPGSFLFGNSPNWIVGGEIVNTGRTYIRSAAMVPEIIIKGDFFKEVYQSIAKKYLTKIEVIKNRPKKIKEDRIYILDKYFEINYNKKGYSLNVPYHIIIQLKKKKEKLLEMNIDNIRSKLTFKGKVILVDELSSLIKYFDKIDLDNGLNTKYPKNQQFLYPDDWDTLFQYIKLLLKPTLTQKNSFRAGFLSLSNIDENWYQFYLEKDFFYAIESSLKAMEALYASDIIAWNNKEKTILETVHHKLINLAEEMDV
jgi:HrpA-like RNA helicase